MLTPPLAADTVVVDAVTGKRWRLLRDYAEGDPLVVVVPDEEGAQRNQRRPPWRFVLPEG